MHYLLIGGVLLIGILSSLLLSAHKKAGEMESQLATMGQERDDAKAQAAALVAASRDHARELAKARKQASSASATVARSADDGCLDRQLPTAIGSLLRMRDEDGKDPAPATPAPGRPKAASEVHRQHLPGLDPMEHRGSGIVHELRGGQARSAQGLQP